jgi:hypothetical protein
VNVIQNCFNQRKKSINQLDSNVQYWGRRVSCEREREKSLEYLIAKWMISLSRCEMLMNFYSHIRGATAKTIIEVGSQLSVCDILTTHHSVAIQLIFFLLLLLIYDAAFRKNRS